MGSREEKGRRVQRRKRYEELNASYPQRFTTLSCYHFSYIHTCVFIGMLSLYATVVYPCKSMCVCVPGSLCVSQSKVGSEAVSQRWEDREAH